MRGVRLQPAPTSTVTPTARLTSHHYTHQALWTGANVLRELGKDPAGGLFASVASALFAYIAFEGFLNDLGETLAPEAWKGERSFFAKRPYKGTMGKLAFLAQEAGYDLDKGRRPYTTLRQLDRRRSGLVHPRTVRLSKSIAFQDAREIPRWLDTDTLTFATDKFLEKVLSDLPELGTALLNAARKTKPKAMRSYPTKAFTGIIGFHDGQIE